MKKFLSILLGIITIFSVAACGKNSGGNDGGDSTLPNKGEMTEYSAQITYGGDPFTETTGLKVQWTNGYEYFQAPVDGSTAKIILPADDYSVSLLGLDSKYAYNSGALLNRATTFTPSLEIPVYRITKARSGSGKDEYHCMRCKALGVYRTEIVESGQRVFYEFEPEENGTYTIESWVDVNANLVNPKLFVYYGSAVFKTYGYTIDEGSYSKGFTRNFKYTINVDDSNVGGVWTFAIGGDHRDGEKHDYMDEPVTVDFALMRDGGFVADKYVAGWQLPEGLYSLIAAELKPLRGLSKDAYLDKTVSFLKTTSTYGSVNVDALKEQLIQEYDVFNGILSEKFDKAATLHYALETTIKNVETKYDEKGQPIKSTIEIDCLLRDYAVLKIKTRFASYEGSGTLLGAETDYYPEDSNKAVLAFRGENYQLSPVTGVYHKYDAQAYADDPFGYGAGYGPVLFGKITVETRFIPSALSMIEYAGNKNLTIEDGTENYKLFIEGYAHMNEMANTPIDSSGQLTGMPGNFPEEYNGVLGYADFVNGNGVVPVTPELKDFFQRFSVSQRLFNDGNGYAETAEPKVDALEEDQWLFACCYYSNP